VCQDPFAVAGRAVSGATLPGDYVHVVIETPVAPGQAWRGADPEPEPARRAAVSVGTPRRSRVAPVDGPPRPGTPKFHLTHIPALDGLRGLAVSATVLFHTQLLTGGYLSMALFFSLSGFLITSLLLEERIVTHGIRLKAFWIRRARRLVPALVGLLLGVSLYARLFGDAAQMAQVRGDTFATMFYVANWHSIFSGHGYWNLFSAPSLLEHTWSLAIEEQFYLVWPLILGTLLWWGKGSLKVVIAFALSLAVGGSLWMAIAYDPSDVSRAYLGTDTRMPALLLGAAFAAWLQWRGPTRSYRVRIAIELVALACVAVIVVMWALLDGTSPLVYRGGMTLCSVAGCALLASCSHPVRGPLAAFTSFRPFCWLGLISYGLYLWHWPVIVVLSPERTGLDGFPLIVLQVGISVGIATVSYYVLEQPIRHRGLAAWRWTAAVPLGALAAVGLTLLLVAAPVTITAEQQAIATLQNTDSAAQVNVPLPVQSDEPVAIAAPDEVVPGRPLPRLAGREPREMFVGDSVALSLGTAMDAEPARWQTKIAQRSAVGCTLDDGSGQTRTATGQIRNEDHSCQTWPTRWAQDVAQFKPDAVLVAFGGLATDPTLLDDGQYHLACDDYYQTWYRKQWDHALQVLSSQGAIVFVALPANVNVRWPGINPLFDCVRPVMRDAVAANPHARLIPLDTWVCPTPQTCRDDENGSKLRFDGVHYIGPGASAANQWIQSQIVEPPAATQ
jgi:peptidoglycan/LPS O-acetylase OafA/YrhL